MQEGGRGCAGQRRWGCRGREGSAVQRCTRGGRGAQEGETGVQPEGIERARGTPHFCPRLLKMPSFRTFIPNRYELTWEHLGKLKYSGIEGLMSFMGEFGVEAKHGCKKSLTRTHTMQQTLDDSDPFFSGGPVRIAAQGGSLTGKKECHCESDQAAEG